MVGFAIYAYWRVTIWLIGRRRHEPRWKTLRYWWPSAMLALIGVAVLLEPVVDRGVGESLYRAFGILLVSLNVPILPAMFLAALTLGVLGLHGCAWYGIIRIVE
jgi:hypothetical protein